MRSNLFIMCSIWLGIHTIMGQEIDTLVRFEYATGNIEFFEYITPTDTPDVAWTNSSPGLNPNIQQMYDIPLPPLYPESIFSELGVANEYMQTNFYPVSTTVKIVSNKVSLFGNEATGTFIGSNLILTLLGYVFEDNPEDTPIDSIRIMPAYDLGEEGSFGSTEANAVYMSIGAYRGTPSDIPFMALLETNIPLGENVGWVGLLFNKNISDYYAHTYFEFNYPNSIIDGDTSERYNGDTLYYGGGELDQFGSTRYLGYDRYSHSGQGGSSLLTIVNDEVVSAGYLTWAAQSRHRAIPYTLYSAVEQIFDEGTSGIGGVPIPDQYSIGQFFPNPFNGQTSIRINMSTMAPLKVSIFNIRGQLLNEELIHATSMGEIYYTWTPDNYISSGVYLIQISSNNLLSLSKVLLVK